MRCCGSTNFIQFVPPPLTSILYFLYLGNLTVKWLLVLCNLHKKVLGSPARSSHWPRAVVQNFPTVVSDWKSEKYWGSFVSYLKHFCGLQKDYTNVPTKLLFWHLFDEHINSVEGGMQWSWVGVTEEWEETWSRRGLWRRSNSQAWWGWKLSCSSVSVQGTVDLWSYIVPINRYSHMV